MHAPSTYKVWAYVDMHGTCNDPMLALPLHTWAHPTESLNTLTVR